MCCVNSNPWLRNRVKMASSSGTATDALASKCSRVPRRQQRASSLNAQMSHLNAAPAG